MEALNSPIWAPIGALLGTIIVTVGNLLPKRGTIENTRLDQLQEDLAAERAEREKLTNRIDEMDKKLDTYRRRDVEWFRHYARVQIGVENGSIPPWPELPHLLRGEHD